MNPSSVDAKLLFQFSKNYKYCKIHFVQEWFADQPPSVGGERAERGGGEGQGRRAGHRGGGRRHHHHHHSNIYLQHHHEEVGPYCKKYLQTYSSLQHFHILGEKTDGPFCAGYVRQNILYSESLKIEEAYSTSMSLCHF